jgi:hypothetical protein
VLALRTWKTGFWSFGGPSSNDAATLGAFLRPSLTSGNLEPFLWNLCSLLHNVPISICT